MSNSINITQTQLDYQISDILNELKRIHQSPYRRSHYRIYKKNSYFISSIFSEIHQVYNLFPNLNSIESALLDEVDLYGFLHLEPTNSRDLQLLEKSIRTKDLLIQIHSYVNQYIEINSKENIAWKKLLEFNLLKESIVKKFLESKTFEGIDSEEIVQIFNIEYEIIIKLLSGEENTYLDKINKFTQILSLAKTVLQSTSSQDYEDAWVLSRALEQNPKELYLIVDEISLISNLPISRRLLQQINEEIVSNEKFKLKDNMFKLNPEVLTEITQEVDLISEKIKGNNLNFYLEFLNTLLPNQLESLQNLAALYKSYESGQSTFILHFNESIIIDKPLLEEMNFEVIYNLINQPQEYNIDFIIQYIYESILRMDFVLNTLEQNENLNQIKVLREVLVDIGNTLIFLNGMNINIFERNNLPSFIDFILIISKSFGIYREVFSSDFHQMKLINKKRSTSSFIIQIESRLNSKVKTIKDLMNLTDNEYLIMRENHNDSIVKKALNSMDEFYLIKTYQVEIIRIYKLLVDNNLYLPPEDELEFILKDLSQGNLNKMKDYLKNICEVLSLSYKELLQYIHFKGINDINVMTITKEYNQEDKDKLIDRYNRIQDIIFILGTFGIKFALIDLEFNSHFSFN